MPGTGGRLLRRASGDLETVPDQSVFARKFRQALEYPSQTVFSASDLAGWLKKEVAEFTKRQPLFGPLKDDGDSREGEFVFLKREATPMLPLRRRQSSEPIERQERQPAVQQSIPQPMLSGLAVLFDENSAVIRDDQRAVLKAVADVLRLTNSDVLVIEGHAYESGTPEYNRVLGERRSQAVLAELMRFGVSAKRLATISYGRDRPISRGTDTTAAAQNRRCSFVFLK
jgi:peptidoglycan-associated lipoprotein